MDFQNLDLDTVWPQFKPRSPPLDWLVCEANVTVSRRVRWVFWMLLSRQSLTSKNNFLFLLLINVVLIAVFSWEWETSSSAAFARPCAQGLNVPGIFSSSTNEAVHGVQYPRQNHWTPHRSQKASCWQRRLWAEDILYIGVRQCHLGGWFLWRSLWEGKQAIPEDHQEEASVLQTPKTDA